MQSQSGQVGDRGHPHDFLESVLQGPLAHLRCLTQVGHVQTFASVRQRVILGDLCDSAVGLPREVSSRKLNGAGRAEGRQQGFENFDMGSGLRLRYVKHIGLSGGHVGQASSPAIQSVGGSGTRLWQLDAVGKAEFVFPMPRRANRTSCSLSPTAQSSQPAQRHLIHQA